MSSYDYHLSSSAVHEAGHSIAAYATGSRSVQCQITEPVHTSHQPAGSDPLVGLVHSAAGWVAERSLSSRPGPWPWEGSADAASAATVLATFPVARREVVWQHALTETSRLVAQYATPIRLLAGHLDQAGLAWDDTVSHICTACGLSRGGFRPRPIPSAPTAPRQAAAALIIRRPRHAAWWHNGGSTGIIRRPCP